MHGLAVAARSPSATAPRLSPPPCPRRALSGRARGPGAVPDAVEVVEVARGPRRLVLVVSRRRARLRLERSPRRLVEARVVIQRPVGVGVVPRGQHDVWIGALDDTG